MADDNTDQQTDPQADQQTSGQDDGTLGEGGVKALQAERAARKAAEKQAAAEAAAKAKLEAELEEFRKNQMSDVEKQIDEARREAAEAARQDVLTEVRGKRLAVEIKAAATGKFTDPDDAVAFLSGDDLDPDDSEAISGALDRLLEQKPHLKASATRATGDIDQGTRTSDSVKQLSRDDVKTMTPAEIVAAREKGQLRDLMSNR